MSASTDKAKRRSAAIVALISSAGTLGYSEAGSTAEVIKAAAKLVPAGFLSRFYGPDGKALETAKPFLALIRDFGLNYQAAHIARYLEERSRSYVNRWGNYDVAQKVDAGREILDKAEPTSEKGNRRTELEQSAVKAAQNRWKYVKENAGLKAKPAPRPQTGANLRRAAGDEKAVPTSSLTPPHFTIATPPVDVVQYFDRLSADLLNKAVNSNAKFIPSNIKTAVQDFRKAIRAAVTSAKAGNVRTAKARATKGTVSAAAIAAKMQTGAKPNGASVN